MNTPLELSGMCVLTTSSGTAQTGAVLASDSAKTRIPGWLPSPLPSPTPGHVTPLIVSVHCVDGACTTFWQDDKQAMAGIVAFALGRRVFAQPSITFAGADGATSFASKVVSLIRVLTPGAMPLALPGSIADVVEIDLAESPTQMGAQGHALSQDPNEYTKKESASLFLEVALAGAWRVNLRLHLRTMEIMHDQRQAFAHFYELPVIAFRLQAGGIGLVNPANITRLTMRPTSEGVPKTAVPAAMLRWTSLLARKWDPETPLKETRYTNHD